MVRIAGVGSSLVLFGSIWYYLVNFGDIWVILEGKPLNFDFIAEFGTKKAMFFDSIAN